jgi:transcriptional regulator with XRE-family HTH domain
MTTKLTDDVVLESLGAGLQRERLSRNLSQAQLATEAGVTRDTIRRLEAGESVSTLTLVRVLKALGMEGSLGSLVPGRGPGPLEQLDSGPAGRQRARASARHGGPVSEWRWGDEDRE